MSDKERGLWTLEITLVGGNAITQKQLPLEEAQQFQESLVAAFEQSDVSGSTTFGDGTLVRHSAVAASKMFQMKTPAPTQVKARPRGYGSPGAPRM